MKPAGYVLTSDPDSGQQRQEIPAYQCVHCGFTWTPQPGSGIERGWCMKCNGPICGRGCADSCVPKEQQLLNIEAGLPANTPGKIVVPSAWFGERA